MYVNLDASSNLADVVPDVGHVAVVGEHQGPLLGAWPTCVYVCVYIYICISNNITCHDNNSNGSTHSHDNDNNNIILQ